MLRVTEIYKSIQGESTFAGLPCAFVRLTGCPLRCAWCDTEYAFYEGVSMSIPEVLDRVERLGTCLVEITGGEPLAQKDCPALAQALLSAGWQVLVETSGALPIHVLPAAAIKIMDLKCPGSGECEKNDFSNLEHLTSRDELKFVIADRADYEWARDVVRERELWKKVAAVHFSPVLDRLAPHKLAEWILADGAPVRLQLQLHKLIWQPDRRGV
ncbi:radical SAM protein [bacterium]|nr:radical SAM protein [bacterium]